MTNQPETNSEPKVWDNLFTVRKQRWGTYVSCSVADDRELITSLTLENCVAATRFYLKGLQEGWADSATERTYDSVVGGKL